MNQSNAGLTESRLGELKYINQYYRFPTYTGAQQFNGPSHSLLPAVLPARTVYAALCLEIIVNTELPRSVGKRASYLLTNPLPAVLAFNGMLNDRVIRRPSVHKCNCVQRNTDADEVEDFVNEGARQVKKGDCQPSPLRIYTANLVPFRRRRTRFIERRNRK